MAALSAGRGRSCDRCPAAADRRGDHSPSMVPGPGPAGTARTTPAARTAADRYKLSQITADQADRRRLSRTNKDQHRPLQAIRASHNRRRPSRDFNNPQTAADFHNTDRHRLPQSTDRRKLPTCRPRVHSGGRVTPAANDRDVKRDLIRDVMSP